MKKGEIVYLARILPKLGIYEVLEAKVRSVYDGWYVAVEKRDKSAILFYDKDIDNTIFKSRGMALNKVLKEEERG